MAAAKLKNKKQAGDGSTLAAVVEKKNENIPYTLLEDEKLPGSRVRFKIHVAEEAFKGRLNSMLREFNAAVAVPGFRRGHTPEAILRKRYEPAIREEAVKRMVGRLSELYTASKGISPLTRPYLLEFKSNAKDGTTVELALEVTPEVTVTDDLLTGLSAEIHSVTIDESVVDQAIENLRKQAAVFEPTTEAYKAGDGAVITCVVKDVHGNVIRERSVSEYYSTNLANELPATVHEGLVGRRTGETFELDVTEEVEGSAPGTMETVHYAVTVGEVKGRVLPEVNDDFAKDVNEKYTSVADLRAGLRSDAEKAEDRRQREETLERIFDQLRDRLDFDLPRALVDQNAQNTVNQMEERLNGMGMSLRQMDNMIVRNYVESVRTQARLTVKNGLLLAAIAKYLGVEVNDVVLNAELERIAAESNRKPLAIRAQLEARKQWDSFAADIRLKLANDALISRTAVTRKPVTAEEFTALARQRQEEQAARLRGEEVKARAQEEAEIKSLNATSAEDLEAKLAGGEIPADAPQG